MVCQGDLARSGIEDLEGGFVLSEIL